MFTRFRILCWVLAALLLSATFLLAPALARNTGSTLPSFESAGPFAPSGMDFGYAYTAAHLLKRGDNLYRPNPPDPATGRPGNVSQFNYGPLVAYLFLPLTALPEAAALKLWIALMLAITLAVLAILSMDFEDKPAFWAVATAWTLSAYPLRFIIERGNIDHLILLLLALAFAADKRPRGAPWAGLCLAAATLIKLYPGIFLVYLAFSRRWKSLAWALGWGTVLVLLTGPLKHYPPFLNMLGTYIEQNTVWIGNHSLGSLTALGITAAMARRWLDILFYLQNLWILPAIKIWGLAVLYGAFGLAAFCVRNRPDARPFCGALLLVPMTLTPSVSHDYNLIVQFLLTAAFLSHYEKSLKAPAAAKPLRGPVVLFIIATAWLYSPLLLKYSQFVFGNPPVTVAPVCPLAQAPLADTLLYILSNKAWPLLILFGLGLLEILNVSFRRTNNKLARSSTYPFGR